MGSRENTRLLSVDFWRGLALLTIFVNHIPGNMFERFTHRNFGFSDATEVFVMLAGVAAALAYLPRFRRGHAGTTSFRIVQRAFQLYMAHIVLIIVCGAIIAHSVATTGDMRYFEALHLDILINDTVPGLVGLAALGLQPAYLNILPLYIVLLIMAPVLLFLAGRSLVAMLALSGALYLASQLLWLNFPTYPSEGWWFLNPLCWQLLFAIGIALGAKIIDGGWPQFPRWLLWISCTYLAVSCVWIVSGFYPSWNPHWIPRFIWDFDKTNLFLPRLLHVLALTYVAAHLPVERWLRDNELMRPFVVLGRHSLAVFCLGTVFAIAAQMVRAQFGGSPGLDTILITSGILSQLVLAGVLEWYRSGSSALSAASQRQHS
ncbi:membrane protein [Terrihabitans soli]|uniref:Membrane protein n=1 Tax=Terrihabitans soli TaxID=708113 RepID=A0A6S6QU07_9HYPH|nr:OpgC domain-containing protein [Terrihabitans soli]BCJ91055.1 membrane protein [Terrihabitans soli]